MTTEFDGHWSEPVGTPKGDVVWLPPGKGGLKIHIATVNGKIVGKVQGSLYGKGFIVKVTGWVWSEPMSGSVAQTLKIKDPHSKGFLDLRTAKMAVEHAISMLPSDAQ